MRYCLLLFIALLCTFHPAKAQTNTKTAEDAILRVWEDEEKEGHIQFFKNGDTYYAKILFGKRLFEADGKTYKKDIHNPDPALRSRSLKEHTLITGLVYKDGRWEDGKIYSFEDGSYYDIYLELKNGLLYMRVYKGITMLGKTLKWHPLP